MTVEITEEEYLKAVDICTLYEIQIKKKFTTENERMKRIDVMVQELIDEFNLKKPTRKQQLVFRRQALMWWLSRNTSYSYEYIGSLFDKDHTTVTHSVKSVNDRIETADSYFNYVVSPILEKLIILRKKNQFVRHRGNYNGKRIKNT